MVRSGVIITLILLSLAFLYVFVSNWKVYEISLQGKGAGGSTKRETRPESEQGSTKLVLANSLVTAMVAPISTKPSPSDSQPEAGADIVTITVVAPEEGGCHPSH